MRQIPDPFAFESVVELLWNRFAEQVHCPDGLNELLRALQLVAATELPPSKCAAFDLEDAQSVQELIDATVQPAQWHRRRLLVSHESAAAVWLLRLLEVAESSQIRAVEEGEIEELISLGRIWLAEALRAEVLDAESHVHTLKLKASALEPDAARGARILASARKGHEATHGTPEQKKARWAKYASRFEQLATAHPRWSTEQICTEVGKEYGVSAKTVRRKIRFNQSTK